MSRSILKAPRAPASKEETPSFPSMYEFPKGDTRRNSRLTKVQEEFNKQYPNNSVTIKNRRLTFKRKANNNNVRTIPTRHQTFARNISWGPSFFDMTKDRERLLYKSASYYEKKINELRQDNADYNMRLQILQENRSISHDAIMDHYNQLLDMNELHEAQQKAFNEKYLAELDDIERRRTEQWVRCQEKQAKLKIKKLDCHKTVIEYFHELINKHMEAYQTFMAALHKRHDYMIRTKHETFKAELAATMV